MRGYVNTLVIIMIVSQLAIQIAPSGYDSKKFVRFICALTVFVCMLSPINTALKNSGELFDNIKSFISLEVETSAESKKFATESAVIMSYVSDSFNISEKHIKTTVITNEDDTAITELHIYIDQCSNLVAEKIESALKRELKVPVYVFVGEEK